MHSGHRPCATWGRDEHPGVIGRTKRGDAVHLDVDQRVVLRREQSPQGGEVDVVGASRREVCQPQFTAHVLPAQATATDRSGSKVCSSTSASRTSPFMRRGELLAPQTVGPPPPVWQPPSPVIRRRERAWGSAIRCQKYRTLLRARSFHRPRPRDVPLVAQ